MAGFTRWEKGCLFVSVSHMAQSWLGVTDKVAVELYVNNKGEEETGQVKKSCGYHPDSCSTFLHTSHSGHFEKWQPFWISSNCMYYPNGDHQVWLINSTQLQRSLSQSFCQLQPVWLFSSDLSTHWKAFICLPILRKKTYRLLCMKTSRYQQLQRYSNQWSCHTQNH